MKPPQDTLRRAALKHLQLGGRCSTGSMALDLDLMFSGYVEITKESNLRVTDAGLAFIHAVPHEHQES